MNIEEIAETEEIAKALEVSGRQVFALRVRRMDAEISRLRGALIGLIGVNTELELRKMEETMRTLPAPEADKAVSINAIHALLATMPAN